MSLTIGHQTETTETRSVTKTIKARRLHVTVDLEDLVLLARPMLAKINPAFEEGEIEVHSRGGYCECEPDIEFIVDLEEVK